VSGYGEGSQAFPNAYVAHATDNLVVLDISRELKTHKRERYPRRDPAIVKRVIYHHSAGRVKPLPQAVHDMAAFFVRSPYWLLPPGPGRGWPGFAYHIFVPFYPEMWWKDQPWGEGRWVVYMTQPFDVYCYHTRTQNDVGVGVLFQGSFNQKRRPSDAQLEVAELLWDGLLKPALGLTDQDLYRHSDFTKPSCPGPQLGAIVETIRLRSAA